MHDNKDFLKAYKHLEITKNDFQECLALEKNILQPEVVYTEDVIRLLKAFKESKISKQDILDWVNTIWFSEMYDYYDKQCDSISSILDKLEELDEHNDELSNATIDQYILLLQKNEELIE